MKRDDTIPRLPARAPDSHKGTYGRILLVTGSEGMTGAAILCARAAYRAGAGLVTVGIDRDLFPVVSTAVPEAIFADASNWRERLSAKALAAYDAVLVGPGTGTRSQRDIAWHLLQARTGPLVVDADALSIVASEPGRAVPRRADRIWTPHPGEFARLTGDAPRGDDERVAAAERFVAARGGVLVLKGWHTVVMDEERWAINETGNPGMATAGAGDVLSGTIAAFLGQGLPPFDAARLAVHLHGRAGDLAVAELGEVSVTAGDIIEHLPPAIREHPVREVPCRKG